MSGLFSTFNIARSGMSVSQKTIDVTSHNISNASTTGYSRQVATIVTNRPESIEGMNAGQMGTGANVDAVSRVRDTFLDFQVRNESSILSKYDTREKFLGEIEGIFNEPSDSALSTKLGAFFDSWQQLSKQPQSSNTRTVVAQQSIALADQLNSTYTQLKRLKDNAEQLVKDNVVNINSKLHDLQQLNQQIVSIKCTGQNPNDLMDKRDNLLDELSKQFNLSVDKKNYEGIDVRATDTNGMVSSKVVTADLNGEAARFSYITDIQKDASDVSGKTYKLTYYKLGEMNDESNRQTMIVTNVSDDQLTQIKQSRILWANSDGVATRGDGSAINNGSAITSGELKVFSPSSGEVAGNASVQTDIDQYIDETNKLAKTLAFAVNTIHSGLASGKLSNGNPDRDYMPFFVNSSVAKYNDRGEMTNLDDILEGEDGITAENIAVNKEIVADVMKIKTKTNDDSYAYTSLNTKDGEGDGSRALAIAQLRNSLLMVQDVGKTINTREDLFNTDRGGNLLTNNGMTIGNNLSGMTLDSYFKNTINTLGVQSKQAQEVVKGQQNVLDSLQQQRDSVSGVSLDEEMANLIQYQHSYSANAKVISTVDQLLDVVINGLMK